MKLKKRERYDKIFFDFNPWLMLISSFPLVFYKTWANFGGELRPIFYGFSSFFHSHMNIKKKIFFSLVEISSFNYLNFWSHGIYFKYSKYLWIFSFFWLSSTKTKLPYLLFLDAQRIQGLKETVCHNFPSSHIKPKEGSGFVFWLTLGHKNVLIENLFTRSQT